MICPNCKKHLNEGFKFCPWCGTKRPEEKICPKCKYSTYDEEFMFCPECGKPLTNKKEYLERLEKFRIEKLRKEEERRKKLEKQVHESELTIKSKDKLYQKINKDIITNEYLLKREIINEIKNEQKERERNKEKNKQKLFLYLNSRYIGTNTKRKLVRKIENGEITTKEEIDAYGPKDVRKGRYRSNEEENQRRRNFDKARPMGMSWSDYLKS